MKLKRVIVSMLVGLPLIAGVVLAYLEYKVRNPMDEVSVTKPAARPRPPANPLRNAYFGELHLHTAISSDANIFDTRNGPRRAYEFAKGAEMELPGVKHAMLRDDAEQPFHQIPMGIEHGHALAVLDVLPDEIEEQRGFARAAGSDDVGVPHPLFGTKMHGNCPSGMFVVTHEDAGRGEGGSGRGLCACPLPLQPGGADFIARQMNKAQQLVPVEQHAAATGQALQQVFLVIVEGILLVVKRDEPVAVGAGEGAQRNRHLPEDV